MPLRIGFDVDGVVADFATAFEEIETRLFGRDAGRAPEQPEVEEEREGRQLLEVRRRRDRVWEEIRSTPDFWRTLRPTADGAIPRIYELTLAHRWEVFFITQRPATAGETVQRQTQRWLADHGFDLPSVLAIRGSRGAAAAALRLDYHVDDSAQHCLDVAVASKARTILVAADPGKSAIPGARKLGVAVVAGIDQALDILEQATLGQSNPSLMQRLATLVGWRSP
jgi:5' nucleotidase, deoxy (Pyrimidine), cytosolic type C protein (NT5C)